MKITNNLNLPQAIVDAVINDKYDKGSAHISITGLLAPPRIRVLSKLHENELEEDVSQRIYSLLGQVMHGILERANTTALAEKRLYLDIEGITISGQMDALYTEGIIQDYKLVSMYQVKDGVKEDFEQQLNCYAYLVKHGYYLFGNNERGTLSISAKTLELVCILRDWSKGKVKYDRDLPQQQVIKLAVTMWDDPKTLAFITERVQIHKAANKKLPFCTSEEMWEKPDKWAVMVPKEEKSRKNHLAKEDAESHAVRVGAKIEYRPGERTRCEDYCAAAKFCTQFQNYKADQSALIKAEGPKKGKKNERK